MILNGARTPDVRGVDAATRRRYRAQLSHSVRDLVEIAFSRVGLDWQKYVKTDPKFLRPAEVDHLIGDPSKARKVLGWDLIVDFKQLVEMMVDADLRRLASRAQGVPAGVTIR